MPRPTLIESLPEPAVDHATMTDFVSTLVEIAVAGRSAEQLFADAALNDCLRFVLMKNRALQDFGIQPWPEASMAEAVRSHFDRLRAAKRH
jgi:hypothetical protein